MSDPRRPDTFHGILAPSWGDDQLLVHLLRDEAELQPTDRDRALLLHVADRIESLAALDATEPAETPLAPIRGTEGLCKWRLWSLGQEYECDLPADHDGDHGCGGEPWPNEPVCVRRPVSPSATPNASRTADDLDSGGANPSPVQATPPVMGDLSEPGNSGEKNVITGATPIAGEGEAAATARGADTKFPSPAATPAAEPTAYERPVGTANSGGPKLRVTRDLNERCPTGSLWRQMEVGADWRRMPGEDPTVLRVEGRTPVGRLVLRRMDGDHEFVWDERTLTRNYDPWHGGGTAEDAP